MKFCSLILFLCMLSSGVCAQPGIRIESVTLTETISNESTSQIPRVVHADANNAVAAKINATLRDRFMIESFEQKEIGEFRWNDVRFQSDISDDIVFIAYEGEYYGAYPSYVEDELFFDLRTGNELTNRDIPFHALFSLEGYLDFMNRFWLAKARKAFKEAMECADVEPYCSYYDIDDYRASENKLDFKLVDDCYARAMLACAPTLSRSVPLDSMKQYLSASGRKTLVQDLYTAKTGIEKYQYNLKTNSTLPDNAFLFGKINGKYAFSMAIAFSNNAAGDVSGYYYYDNKLQKIILKGTKSGEDIVLREFVAGKITGNFTLKFERGAQHPTGTWSNPEKTKTFPVDFTEVKSNR